MGAIFFHIDPIKHRRLLEKSDKVKTEKTGDSEISEGNKSYCTQEKWGGGVVVSGEVTLDLFRLISGNYGLQKKKYNEKHKF